MESNEELVTKITSAVELLNEHFDTVHIFCTLHENTEDGTRAFNVGRGNWYARIGHINEWLTEGDENARLSAREKE